MLTRLIREQRPVFEIADRTKFRRVVGARPGQRVRVIVQVAARHPTHPGENGPWWDFMEFWEGPWASDLPIPTEPELQACMLQAGAAFARPVIRAVI